MIFGHGIDLQEISAVKKAYDRNPRFAKKVLTPKEWERFESLSGNRQMSYLAGRWAGKEAFSKAWGTGIGAVGGTIAYFFGGWDQALVTLIIFMAIDYISGLIVAGVFHNSKKTESGTLESRTGWKGLCRKCMTLLFVLVAYRLDLAIGVDYIRDAVIIGFMANELISIVENAGLMGIPLPAVIANAIDILTQKAEKNGDA